MIGESGAVSTVFRKCGGTRKNALTTGSAASGDPRTACSFGVLSSVSVLREGVVGQRPVSSSPGAIAWVVTHKSSGTKDREEEPRIERIKTDVRGSVRADPSPPSNPWLSGSIGVRAFVMRYSIASRSTALAVVASFRSSVEPKKRYGAATRLAARRRCVRFPLHLLVHSVEG